MNILALGLDRNLANPKLPGASRQVAYFRGHFAKIFVLETGVPGELRVENVTVCVPGGAHKIFVVMRMFRALLRDPVRYDLVIAQDVLLLGLLGYLVALRYGARLITQVHGDYLDNPRWLNERVGNRVRNAIGKFILKQSDGIRCVSKKIVDDLHSRLGVPLEKMLSAPIGTDLTMFVPDGNRADIGGRYVLFVGRLLPEKSPLLYCGVMTTLMSEFPDLHTVIAGEGTLRTEMEKHFADAGMTARAHFIGHVSGDDLAKYYRGATAMLHTAAWEGWGMPMVESLASGCPVVTSDTGCAGEAVIDGANGIVVPIDDIVGMTKGVRKLLTDSAFRDKLAQNGSKSAQEWSFDMLAVKIKSWYETIGMPKKL